MSRLSILCICFAVLAAGPGRVQAAAPLSDATQECLDCHASVTPGIVADWRSGRHAAMSVAQSLGGDNAVRRITAGEVPEKLRGVAVGCAECHTLRPDRHADTFEHNGHRVHVVVSPRDCAVCHTEEASQYAENLMSRAYGNLKDNPLYAKLQVSIIGDTGEKDGRITFAPADARTRAVGCYYCHGTRLAFKGLETRETDVGDLAFPVIDGWPSQGVGRVNLDGSLGACTACHGRHSFSIEMARKPGTCKQCHVGPDVPAYRVYAASKHAGIYESLGAHWNFQAVPWTVGRDFKAPTCAVCHASQLVGEDGELLVERTHRMNDRLPKRLYGLIYTHAHPRSPDTSIIRNADGQPLPTTLDGRPAEAFLIDQKEQGRRLKNMQAVCRGCHSTTWVRGHWARLDRTVAVTDAAVKQATGIMQRIWRAGYARGPAEGGNPFDENIERTWTELWLFYANSTRFAAAMAGGGDYGVFAEGRFNLSQNMVELAEWLQQQEKLEGKASKEKSAE